MTDYVRDIPNGTMMIRDTGGWVEFWFKTGSSTFNHQQTWGYLVDDGGYIQQDYDLSQGGSWQKFGAVYLGGGANYNVLFRIIGEGLGWPTTDFSVTIQRQSLPPPPNWTYWAALTDHAVRLQFASTGDGGSSILEWQIGYGTSEWQPQYFIGSNGSTDLTNLISGVVYYFWVRGRNAYGWSGWSRRIEVRTMSVPFRPFPVETLTATQTSFVAKAKIPYDGGSGLLEVQLGYGTDPNAPQLFDNRPLVELQALTPGRKHYAWFRARNAYGWSLWSARSEIALVAGAWLKDGGEWKRALPWVNVGGVWHIGKGNVGVNGTWKASKS